MAIFSADVMFFYLLLTVPLETNYLRTYRIDLHQIFRIDTSINQSINFIDERVKNH